MYLWSGCQLTPGNASGPGILQVGNVYFEGGTLNEQIDGASPGTYGQLQIAAGDKMYLSGGALNVTLATDFSPAQGETFDIFTGQSSNQVSGNFSGLPEGSTLTAKGSTTQFKITYAGSNDPTDMQLATISTPAGSDSISGNVYTTELQRHLDREPGLQGWTVYLDDNGNGALDPGEERAITDANGNFSFANLAAGTYTLREVLPTGWVQTLRRAGRPCATR